MRWSKLRALIESRFCPELKGRITINSTRHGNCSCGHAWLTMDRKVIANFCTRAFWNTGPRFDPERGRFVSRKPTEKQNARYKDQFVEYGELSRQDAYVSCFDFIHSPSIEEALKSEDPLIQTLAVLDERLGDRRIKQIDPSLLHPLAKKLLQEREQAHHRGPNPPTPCGSSEAPASVMPDGI